jgi:hypothetical protein
MSFPCCPHEAPCAEHRDKQILRALSLRPAPALRISQERDGSLLIVEEGDGGEGIVGLAVPDEEDGGWYLGCFKCRAEIEVADGGICAGCRSDLDHEQAMHEHDHS